MPTNDIRISMLDQDVSIKTDSSTYQEFLIKTYYHFLVNQPKPEAVTPFNVLINFEHDDCNERPKFIINDEAIYHDKQQRLPNEYIHGLIINSLYSQISSHFLFHAATLSIDGKGILLCGDSGYGKTTLSLAMIQRGYRFLSDEIAALRRSDGIIDPFPRSLNVREPSFELLNISVPFGKTSHFSGKYLVDIDEIFPGIIGEPAKLSYIFILKNETMSKSSSLNSHEFKAIVSHTNSTFLNHLQAIPGFINFEVTNDSSYPCLVIQTTHKGNFIPFFEDLCKKDGILILDLIKREDHSINFSSTIRYQTFSKSNTARELLRHFVGGHKTILLTPQYYKNSTKLLFELASLLENVQCYQVGIGPLNDMVNQISNLIIDNNASNS